QAYVQAVRDREFRAMRGGNADPSAARALDRVFGAVQSTQPTTHVQVKFYDVAVASLGRGLDERHKRLAKAGESLPQAFWILIILTAAASLATTFFLKVETVGLEAFIVAAVAVVIGVGILTTLLLEYPFSGSVAVSSDPFTQGVLSSGPWSGP